MNDVSRLVLDSIDLDSMSIQSHDFRDDNDPIGENLPAPSGEPPLSGFTDSFDMIVISPPITPPPILPLGPAEADPTNDVITSPDQSFTGTLLNGFTVAYWSFDLPANLLVDLGAGSVKFYDVNDYLSGPRGVRLYHQFREDTLTSINNVIGSASGDTMIGDSGANLLVGMGAGPGFTGSGNVRRSGLLEINRVQDGLESRVQSYNDIDGGGGNDMLLGDLGAFGGAFDLIRGGTGNDTIDGGIGQGDEFYGDAGADAFSFTTPSGLYHIMDWTQGQDVIFIQEAGTTISDVTLTQNGADLHMTFGDAEIILHDRVAADLNLITDVVFA